MGQGFLIFRGYGTRVNDALPGRHLPIARNEKRRDIVLQAAAAAQAALEMALSARSGIEDWAQAVARSRQGIIDRPLMREQHSALARRRPIDRAWRNRCPQPQ